MPIKQPHFIPFLKKNKNNLVFILLLLSISILYGYPQILKSRPYSIHQWRQADCLSITMNYYKENRNFLEPAVHWQGGGKDGKTISEFPVIYYSVAQLWKVFGYHEYIFRLVNIFIVFIGLFCFYKLLSGILKDLFWSLIVGILLFTSPILVYYTNNFTADAPAFGLALTACFFIWNGWQKQNKTWYYLSFVFFLLAGLIKISSLISFFAIFIVHFYLLVFGKKHQLWIGKFYHLIPYFVVIIIITTWYKYVIDYNQKNVSGIFLTGIYPIWDLDANQIKHNWFCLYHDLLPAYFNKIAFYLNLFIFASLFFFYKKVNKLLFALCILIFMALIAYGILFYKAFTVHDYYLTNLLIFMPLPIITLLEMLKRNYLTIFQNRLLKWIAIASTLVLIYQTTVINRMKYFSKDAIVENNIAVDKSETDFWAWYHYDYSVHHKAYETITPYLRKFGLKRTGKILCLPDISINVSLYLMDQKGYTAFSFETISLDQKMKIYRQNGVQFLIMDSTFYQQNDSLKYYVQNKIGNYQNINIYQLK